MSSGRDVDAAVDSHYSLFLLCVMVPVSGRSQVSSVFL